MIETRNTTTNIEISNANTSIKYEVYDKSITGVDKNDFNNYPAFYTTSKKNLKEAWKEIIKSFDESTTMYSVIEILTKHDVRVHSYCQMD